MESLDDFYVVDMFYHLNVITCPVHVVARLLFICCWTQVRKIIYSPFCISSGISCMFSDIGYPFWIASFGYIASIRYRCIHHTYTTLRHIQDRISWQDIYFVLNHNFLTNRNPRKQIPTICQTKDDSLHRNFLLSQNSWSHGNILIVCVL